MLRPRSILSLTLLGFSLVALPLIFALVNTALYVDKLVKHSQKAVSQTIKTTQNSYRLVGQVTDMERNVRQFQILGDISLLQLYESNHRDVQEMVEVLARFSSDESYHRLLDDFSRKEMSIFTGLRTYSNDPKKIQLMVARFANLADLAQKILTESHRIINRELTTIETTANRVESVLAWQAIALVPTALLLTAVFTILITRPIAQLDNAIRHLGNAQFTIPIQITGPQDLVYVGQRLDWLRRRLLELEAGKNRFLRHVSHELKTPLTAIREGSQLLLDEVVGKLLDGQREIAHILKKNSLQLQKLIENLLNFSAVHFQTLSLNLANHPFKRLIERTILDHSLVIKSKSLYIEMDLQDVVIEGDGDKLKGIVDNLLSNAMKYAPPASIVRINLFLKEEQVILEVIDQGPGVTSTDKPKIFDAFYQGKTRPQGAVKGSGLGLSIVKEYVTAHQGRVELLETVKGAHFRVTLPRQLPKYYAENS